VAFALAAFGPLIAGLLVFLLMAPKAPAVAATRLGVIAGFKLVFKNKPALGYIFGYVAHCWELYGSRAWMVAFLTFAAGSATGIAGNLSAPTLASIISLGGIASSIGCNEFAKRFGRANLVTGIMQTGLVFGIWRATTRR
jgi:hypothetical protein